MASSGTAFCYLALLSLSIICAEAREFIVRTGNRYWSIPSEADSFNKWAQALRFQIGDTLVFQYDAKKDSVLQVSKEAYESCNTANPIARYEGGNVNVTLDRSGPFYFISGVEANCQKGQKLITVVMAPRRQGFYPVSPAPAPAESQLGPAAAPVTGGAAMSGGFAIMLLGALMGLHLL